MSCTLFGLPIILNKVLIELLVAGTPATESARAVYGNFYSILVYLAGSLSTLSPFFFRHWFSHYPRLRVLASVFGSGLIVAYLLWIPRKARKMMLGYCDQCMKEDLKDIVTHYELRPAKSSNGKDQYEPIDKGCFWVAEYEDKIVGCIGLGTFSP